MLIEHTQNALPNRAGILAGVNAGPDASFLVVINHRGRLDMVRAQPLLECFGIVIGSLDQRLASHIVQHGLLRRAKHFVICTTRGWVDQSAGDPRDEKGIVNLQLHRMFEGFLLFGEHLVQALGLRNSSWETI